MSAYQVNEYFYVCFYVFVVWWVEPYDVSFPVGFYFCAVWCVCKCCRKSTIFWGCFIIFLASLKMVSLEELSKILRLIDCRICLTIDGGWLKMCGYKVVCC